MKAIDWTLGAGRPPAEPPAGVDIIIPVYGAAEALRKCLVSVEACTDIERHRLLIVMDGPQSRAVERLVAPWFHVLRNPLRQGFVGAVNRGMKASNRDVILLNSDTIVTPRWVEKLLAAAYSSGDVGTVTPLSNHATLCSVPRAFEENLLPSGMDAAAFAAHVESVSARSYPRLPTGVGVCLYIRRALLDDIGYFDAERFGLGYGEENDFCLRAIARGWVHVADDATFIEHAGHRSFGSSRALLQVEARKTLCKLHPRYTATIAEFMRRDPLAEVRSRIDAVRSKGRRITHLVHGWPPFQQAGTELYAYWLARQQAPTHRVSVYTRSADPARGDGEAVELMDGGMRVRLVANHFTARDPLRRNGITNRPLERDFERFLREEETELLHVHHLAGHAFSLIRVARRLGIPIVLQIQDWWFRCARVNQFDRQGNRCSGPAIEKCARCVTLTNIAGSNRLLHAIRRRAAQAAIDAADAYVVGSEAIRNDYASMLSKPIHVIPYGIAVPAACAAREAARKPLRFGYVGSVAPHKGLHVAADALHGIAEAELVVFGDFSAYPEYTADLRERCAAVRFEGRFREDEKERVFAAMDVLLVPSIGLESFGLAAREAMACGVPVIASAGGALSEMFDDGACGELFPAGDAAALRRIVQRLMADPSIVDEWRRHLPQPKRSEAHATEIEWVYQSVLR
ncbi:MAG TPA: glycosyltransferase [Thermoanaerobaculia bacterium]|nr:glycosyltransferase [Thermoanaerobaculia bacterium]